MEEKFILSILVNNRYGILARVASMFRRRGFNIDTLTVGETENPEFSRITATFKGDAKISKQIQSQLMKMHDVIAVKELQRDNSVARELVLVKIKNCAKNRQDIMQIVDVFRAKVIDYGMDVMTVEITGESSKIDAFIRLANEYEIVEICRTGIVALERGKANISQK